VLGHDGLRFPMSESSQNGEGTGEAFWRFEIGVGGRTFGLPETADTGGTCCCCCVGCSCCVALWLLKDSSKRFKKYIFEESNELIAHKHKFWLLNLSFLGPDKLIFKAHVLVRRENSLF
jgi:hypothetical protein